MDLSYVKFIIIILIYIHFQRSVCNCIYCFWASFMQIIKKNVWCSVLISPVMKWLLHCKFHDIRANAAGLISLVCSSRCALITHDSGKQKHNQISCSSAEHDSFCQSHLQPLPSKTSNVTLYDGQLLCRIFFVKSFESVVV